MKFKCSFRLALCFAAVALMAPAARADFLAPGVTVAGQSQAALAASWWQWALSYPTSNNPLLDPDGRHSSLGNQGGVFYLAGFAGLNNQGVFGVADRTVTVSPSQALFFPVINSVGATSDGIPAAALPKAVADVLGTPDSMHATLINVGTGQTQTLGLSDLLKHRQTPGLFNLTLGADNAYGAAPGTYPAATDGYWLALGPLAPGVYDLKFGGHSLGHLPTDFGFNGGPIENTQTISYRITSQTPEPAAWLLAVIGALPLYRCLRAGRKAHRHADQGKAGC